MDHCFIQFTILRFVGFGYLMTFLKTYGLGAVGLTMLITAIGIQWYLFCESFFRQWYANDNDAEAWVNVNVNIYALTKALFGVSSVLISFGAVIGKVKPFQLVIMTISSLVFHAFNAEIILAGAMKTADIGGTYAYHMFGAYFGLSVSYFLKRSKQPADPPTGYIADIFSMVGTLFLWIYWPSFVGGLAEADSGQQDRAIVNTILALSASTICTFYLSSDRSSGHIFRPADIQNATLAGGVAVGCIANLNLNPVNAILVGCGAGFASTLGYQVLQPFLYNKFGLHDTCGIHNLHGMPSIIGGIASICISAYKQSGGRNHDSEVFRSHHGNEAWRQFVSILLVVTCGIVSGAITAWIMNVVEPDAEHTEFDDQLYWETAGDFKSEESTKNVDNGFVVVSQSSKKGGEEFQINVQ